MLLEKISDYCNESHNTHKCNKCSYEENCPDDCGKCLDYIHYPKNSPSKRKYDCSNMANYYLCRYCYSFTSELIFLFRLLKDIKDLHDLKVLSIGCGANTDLLALDYLKQNDELYFHRLEYRGIDYSKNVWKFIHEKIKYISDYNIKYTYVDICKYIDKFVKRRWYPNVIVFQYVLSDMYKHGDDSNNRAMLRKLSTFIKDKLPLNTYIVINDINLSFEHSGGRDYFDIFFDMLKPNCDCKKTHFKKDGKKFFKYGGSKNTITNNQQTIHTPREYRERYKALTKCSSAQIIIKKVK